jgi:hypothetical protein
MKSSARLAALTAAAWLAFYAAMLLFVWIAAGVVGSPARDSR